MTAVAQIEIPRMTPHFGKTLRRLIRDRHFRNHAEFAEAAGISTDTLYRHLKSSKPPGYGSTYASIAKALGLQPQHLDQMWNPERQSEDPLPGNFTIPRVGGVAAGTFREFEIDVLNAEGVPGQLYPYPLRGPMVLRVHGDSMTWDRAESIGDGDDVIFCDEYEEPIPDNDIVVAKHNLDDSMTVKRVRFIDEKWLELIAHNRRYDPIRLERTQVTLRRVKVIVVNRYKGHQAG